MRIQYAVTVFVISVAFSAGCGSSTNPGNDAMVDTSTQADVQTEDVTADTADAADRDVKPDTGDAEDQPDTSTDTAPEVTGDATGDAADSDDRDTVTDLASDDTIEDTADIPTTPWKKLSVHIDDPVVNGDNVMNAVDGVTFGYDPTLAEYVTEFGHNWDDTSVSYIWHLDETTGSHTKKILTGSPFEDGTNFCMDEDWCQFITRHDGKWIVMGPRTPTVMAVDETYNATQSDAVTGDQPPNGAISYTHLFDGGTLYVFGFITASGFCESLYTFNMETGVWSIPISGLTPIYANCVAYSNDVLYSVGGVTTDDGGETSYAYGKLVEIATDGSSSNEIDLPAGMAGREAMSCAFDQENGLLYVFGGAEMVDNRDETKNTYHNDLWVWDGDEWTRLLEDGNTGTFNQYGESWMFKGDPMLPNFGKNTGRMTFDDSESPRLILMGDVPGSATQIYTLTISDI